MTPEQMVAAAIDVAEEGMAAGELPIGAVVVMGEEIIGRAYAQERSAGRRLCHADILAMEQPDKPLGWSARPHPLQLAINLEPCVMCLGAAMMLGVSDVYYSLESPGDGAHHVARSWQNSDDTPFFRVPAVAGGVLRAVSQDQFRRYCQTAPASGYRRRAETLT